MTTEERLEKLERELTETKALAARRPDVRRGWLLAVVGVAVVGLGLAWTLAKTTATAQAQAAGAVPKTIRANEFILEDADGKRRAWLGVDKDGPGLHLLDENGKPRAVLTVTKDGPGLNLYDEKGNGRAALGVLKDGAALALFDEKGKGRTTLGVNQTVTPDGKTITYPESSLLLFDEKGKRIWSAP